MVSEDNGDDAWEVSSKSVFGFVLFFIFSSASHSLSDASPSLATGSSKALTQHRLKSQLFLSF
ncbi:hypothetical protein ACXWO0_11585, partial [Streptococcus pyogenes]